MARSGAGDERHLICNGEGCFHTEDLDCDGGRLVCTVESLGCLDKVARTEEGTREPDIRGGVVSEDSEAGKIGGAEDRTGAAVVGGGGAD